MQRLDCGHCLRYLTQLRRDPSRFDWVAVEAWDSKRLIERVHGFSRWTGKSLCGRRTLR